MVESARVRDTLLRLLAMNSPSGHESPVADFLEAELRGMGFLTWRDNAGATINGDTGNVLARLEGNVPGAPAILLNAHMDTVAPTKDLVIHETDGVLHSAGDTILGADDKAGLTAILEGIREALALGVPRPTLEIAFTVGEEIGLVGAKHLDCAALQARQAYTFDSGKPVGNIVRSAPAQNSITAIVQGKAAHAGMEPEKGINAIRIAAEAICRMPLGRIDAETTSNIGIIQGGQANNIVPDRVECSGEARSRDAAKLAKQTQAIEEAFRAAAQAAGGQATVQVHQAYASFYLGDDDPLVRRAVMAGQRAGVSEPEVQDGGGGSDANIFNAHGLPTVVIGLGYENVHGVHEKVAVADVTQAAQIAVELIRLAGENADR